MVVQTAHQARPVRALGLSARTVRPGGEVRGGVSYADLVSNCAPRPSILRRRPFECVLCGSTQGRRCARSRGWSVVRCSGCGLRRTWPPPDAAALERLHDDDDYYAQRGMGDGHEQAWDERAGEVLGLLALAEPGPVLDFGAGDGGLVAALRAQGIDADGVESSPAGRHLA